MYFLNGDKANQIKPTTFSELDWKESDIEEMLRKNIEILHEEEESLLVVGQQVLNQSGGRSDLTAVDNNGNLVLIEIKRDPRDILSRKEAFEFQAIRYAASYATIKSPNELVEKVYAPFIEKHERQEEQSTLTAYEKASRRLMEFLELNGATSTFNVKQRIILVASDFDEQTLSAVAWLNSNLVDISCLKLIPFQWGGMESAIVFKVEKILPVPDYSDFYVDLQDRGRSQPSRKASIKRRSLPRITDMLDWGVIAPGDIIVAKNKGDEAELLANGNVVANGIEQSMQAWLKEIYGWSSVQTYVFAVDKKSGKTLNEIRDAYIEKQTEVNQS